MLMQRARSAPSRRPPSLDRGPRVEGDADAEPERAGALDRRRRIGDDLDVEGDTVGAGLLEPHEVPFRLGHHQVAIERSAPLVDELGDRRGARSGRS